MSQDIIAIVKEVSLQQGYKVSVQCSEREREVHKYLFLLVSPPFPTVVFCFFN